MAAPHRPDQPVVRRRRLRLPRRTVRLRLTLLYGVLFLASGAGLLAITYAFVVHQDTGSSLIAASDVGHTSATLELPTSSAATGIHCPVDCGRSATIFAEAFSDGASTQVATENRELLEESGFVLLGMAVFSVGLGWYVSGRVLRPLRTITATTRKFSEKNLHERLGISGPRDELKDLGDTIDGLLERLELAFDTERRFVANASHELRTPLAMMRTSLDVATTKPGGVPREVTVLAAKVREGLDQSEQLVESFLVLARAQHEMVATPTAVDLDGLVCTALDDRRHTVTSRGLKVQLHLGQATVRGSETLLTRLVGNLIDNAISHNVEEGSIWVATSVHGSLASLEVENDGPVLESTQVAELGRPFLRLGPERVAPNSGQGLGLSIVSAIVSTHRGSLRLSARPDGGVKVVVNLPSGGGNRPAGDL
jgi:signal transduction histidine kinase